MSIWKNITQIVITKTDTVAKVIFKRDVVVLEGVVAGQDKEVQFNDGGILATNSAFTFDKSNGKLSSTKFSGDGSELTNLPAQVPYVHNHDDRYYTESEIATILLNYYTETEVNNLLAGKQNVMGANENYVTDAQLLVITNTSNTNTGDQVGDGVTITGAGTVADPFVSIGGGSGDVIAPAINTDSYIPQWNGANSKTLKDGLAVPTGGLAGLTALGNKVDKVAGLSLVADTEITKLSGVEASAVALTTVKSDADIASAISLKHASGSDNQASSDFEIADLTDIGSLRNSWTGKQDALGFTPENTANKDATGGYVGLTLFKINFKNVLNTITSFFTNSNTVARTYTFQDRNGTIADDTDLSGKVDKVTSYSLVADTEISKLAGIEAGADVTDAVNVGSSIFGVGDKATPVDADIVGYIDTEASNVLKKLTWTNIKAFLKTYFDGIYQAAGNYFNKTSDTLDNVPDGTTYKLVTAAEKTVLGNTSGSNTGDNSANTSSVPIASYTAADEVMVGTGAGTTAQITLAASQILGKKAAGTVTNLTAAELRTILNVADGANVNNISDVNATDLTDGGETALHSHAGGGGGSSLWTLMTGTPTRVGNTSFTVTGDITAYVKKGMIIKWEEAAAIKVAMVSIPSTYGDPNTTITIIGDVMASIDASSLKYCMLGVEMFQKNFAVAGTIGAVLADVANSYYATEPMRVIGADLQVGTAGTTNSTTIDINIDGTTCFTTKPTLASTVASSPLPFTADNGTSLALGNKVTMDIDAIQVTSAIDLYCQLYVLPTRYLYLT